MNFSVEILKHPTDEDWMLAKRCTLVTIGKDSMKPPTMEWKHKLLAARHSPIRTLEFCFKINNIPSWVATHLVRHIHAVPFVKHNAVIDNRNINAKMRHNLLLLICVGL